MDDIETGNKGNKERKDGKNGWCSVLGIIE